MKRPATAGTIRSNRAAHGNAGISSSEGRPQTAEVNRRTSRRGSMMLGRPKTAKAKQAEMVPANELIAGLETEMRKIVDTKRASYDKLIFELKKQREMVDKLETTENDLKKTAEALGIMQYKDDAERLEPITLISRKPFYSKRTVSYHISHDGRH